MPLNSNLPVSLVDGAPGHTDGHNATNLLVNQTAAALNALNADSDLAGLLGLGDGYPRRVAGVWQAQTAAALAAALGVGSGGGGGSFTDAHFNEEWVDPRDYGAVGDSVAATGAGTDSTSAFNQARAAANGRKVLIPPGRFKITGPINGDVGTAFCAYERPHYIGAVGNQGPAYVPVIDFYGGPTDNCFQFNLSGSANSQGAVSGVAIIDRRSSPTSGDAIHMDHVVNQTVVRRVYVNGFSTGNGIWVSATVAPTDCVDIDDVWLLGCQYGITVGNTDNIVTITKVKSDNPTGVTQAVIRILGTVRSVVDIRDVKHEAGNWQVPTILINGIGRGIKIDSVVSRVGNAGPIVKITDTDGGGISAKNLIREQAGTMIELPTYSIGNRTRLAEWQGGNAADAHLFNQAGISSNSLTTADLARLYIVGNLWAAAIGSVTDEGKVSIAPDTAAQPGLTVRGITGQTANIMRVYDGSGSAFVVDSGGNTKVSRDAVISGTTTLAGAIAESKRTAVVDADYVCAATDFVVAVTSLTAPRTITLPAVSTGRRIIVLDESGQAGTYPITVTRAGAPAQLIDGAISVTIAAAYGALSVWSNGTNWFTRRSSAPTSTGGGSAPDVQTFTADGTWTKPAGATLVRVIAVGGGGGGGSGRRGAAASTRTGGGGGGGAAREESVILASVLGATEAVTVGVGGAGGAAITTNDTAGNAGANGTGSTFGARSGLYLVNTQTAGGGVGGGTGQANGGAAGTGGAAIGGVGGISSNSGSTGGAGGNASSASPGGGGGGGISSGDVASGGGGGGRNYTSVTNPTSGSAAGANGTAGTSAPTSSARAYTAGTGGGASTSADAGSGGNGGLYGSGGGGGGASLNGFASGKGGDGANGIVIVISQ